MDAQEIIAAVSAGEVSEAESDARAEKFEENDNLSTVYAETLKGEVAPVQHTLSEVRRTIEKKETRESLSLSKVKKVEEDRDGNYVVSYRNGSRAKVSDMDLGELDYNTRHIYQWASHADSAEEARKILQNRPEGMGFSEYNKAFTDVMHAAMIETPASEIRADYLELSDRQFETIYHHGELKAAEMAKKNTNAEQMAAVKALSEMAGIKVQLGGRDLSGSNGIYDPSDNTIYVSDKSLNPAAVVTGHEIVHSMKKNAPELYQKLDEALTGYWEEKDPVTYRHIYENRAKRYGDQIKEWRAAGKSEAEIGDLVNEEIVAHSTEALFEKWGSMNEEEQREFAEEIVKDDRSLAEKLLDFVRDLLNKLKNALKGYKATSLEARALNRNVELLTSFEDTFTDVLAEYGERNKAEGKTGEVVDKRGQESKEQQPGNARYNKKNGSFAEQYDAWDKKNPRVKFTLGITPKTLVALGAKKGKIIINASKVNQIKKDHDEMTDEVIKKIPEVINDPVIIMDSKTVPGRLVMFGDLYANNNNNVMVAIELHPTDNNEMEIKGVMVTSAYGRSNGNIKNLVTQSNIRYINPDKNKTNRWIARTGVQFPFGISVGYNGIVTSSKGKSNKNTEKNVEKRNSLKEVEDESLQLGFAETEDGRLALQNPKELSTEQWGTIAKVANKLGYEIGTAKDAKEVYTNLAENSKKYGREIGLLFPDDLSDELKKAFGIEKVDEAKEKENESKYKEIAKKAEKVFGTTTNYDLAGYLDVNGKLLDFSEGQRYRVQDHREISNILDLPEDADYSDGLIEFMNEGNIRLQTYGIDIAVKPNEAQRKVLRDLFNLKNGEVDIDFSRKDGSTAGSAEYRKGTASTRILSDIDSFFDSGEVPKGTSNGLRFSKKEIEDINEIFEAEAERLHDLDFDKEMRRIANEEKKLNFSSKDYPVFKRMATDLAKDYDSKVDRDELAEMLFHTANHWVNQGNKADLSDVVRSMVGIARPLMEETRLVDNSTKEDYENLKSLLRGRRIALTDTQKEEIRNEKGTLQGFGMGYFTQASNGIPLDAIWSELVKESGYLLDPDVNEGEMPIQLMEALEALKPKMGLAQYKENGMDENQMAIDIV